MSRFLLGSNDVIDPASETIIVSNIPRRAAITMQATCTGKDGYLYISIGDGGTDTRATLGLRWRQ